jgi:hypothetical protein
MHADNDVSKDTVICCTVCVDSDEWLYVCSAVVVVCLPRERPVQHHKVMHNVAVAQEHCNSLQRHRVAGLTRRYCACAQLLSLM